MTLQRVLEPVLMHIAKKDVETAHELALRCLHFIGQSRRLREHVRRQTMVWDLRLKQSLLNAEFDHPLGLAAGFGKDGDVLHGLKAMGFSFIEMGSLTKFAQPGNPRPRLFRLESDRALVNAMGFNNSGVFAAAPRLEHLAARDPLGLPLGINIGKNKDVPNRGAVEAYRGAFRQIFDYGTYVAVNVSSPNTEDLRELQEGSQLRALLLGIMQLNHELAAERERSPTPIFVKVDPDIPEAEVKTMVEVCSETGVAGIIATNTTISRDGLSQPTDKPGGISGPPLREKALNRARQIRAYLPNDMLLIGVGGITTPQDAWDRLEAGAHLIQGFTGFAYQWWSYVPTIVRGLLDLMDQKGITHVSQIYKA